jgi:hypothetical protein
MDVSLVIRDVDIGSASAVAALHALLVELSELEFVARITRSWLLDYQKWCACLDCAPAFDSSSSASSSSASAFSSSSAEAGAGGGSERSSSALSSTASLAAGTRALTRASLEAFLADEATYSECAGSGSGGGGGGGGGGGNATGAMGRRALQAAAAAAEAEEGWGAGMPREGRQLSIVSFMVDAFDTVRSQRGEMAKAIVTGGKEYDSDIVLERSGRAYIRAMRFPLAVRMPADNDACYLEHYPRFEAALSAHGFDGFVYHPRYEFGAIDTRMSRMSLTNLLVAAAAIAMSTSLFLPPLISLTLVLLVGSIDVLLVGVLILAGLRLNAITFVTLLVSLALAIDYSCHIGHAYEMAEEGTRRDKVLRLASDAVGAGVGACEGARVGGWGGASARACGHGRGSQGA